MNSLERKMVDALIDLRKNHHVIGIKAEFETEGTRLEEALRLKDVCLSAGLPLTIKIGGAEAIRDMYECRAIGVERLVAPMIESAYALGKFLGAVKLVFPPDERSDIIFAINIETISGYRAFDEMLALPNIGELGGVVMGRVDFSGSMGRFREDTDGDWIFGLTQDLFARAKTRSLECAVGGAVSAASLPFFRRLPTGYLDRYETRKVIFGCPGGLEGDAEKGILKAVGFELMWLKNKRDYYALIAGEDLERIEMLESRWKESIESAGGQYE